MRVGMLLLVVLFGLSGFATPAAAQFLVTPRTLGTGGAYIGMARGQDALFTNPANLALSENPSWSVSLLQVGLGGSILGVSFSDFTQLAEDDLDDEDWSREFLERVPASGLRLNGEVRVPLIAGQFGPFAAGLSAGVVGQQTLGRDLVDLILLGYEEGRRDYTVGNTTGWSADHLDFAVAYGRRVGPLAVGVTGHYLHGGTLSRSRLLDPRYDENGEPIQIDYLEVLARGGRGLSLDVGAAMEPLPRLTVSAALSNLIGGMWWSNETLIRSLSLTEEEIDEDMFERFDGSTRPFVAENEPAEAAELATTLRDGARLPPTFRLGAAYSPWTGGTVGVALQRRLMSGRMAGDWDPTLSLGVQQRLWIVSLRAGYGLLADGGNLLSGGLSLGPLDLGMAFLGGRSQSHPQTGVMATLGFSTRGPIAP